MIELRTEKNNTGVSGHNYEDCIVIKGAKENNLHNLDLAIPRNKLIVFTGISGSGKSTLAFDTIFAEGRGVMSKACRLTPA